MTFIISSNESTLEEKRDHFPVRVGRTGGGACGQLDGDVVIV